MNAVLRWVAIFLVAEVVFISLWIAAHGGLQDES